MTPPTGDGASLWLLGVAWALHAAWWPRASKVNAALDVVVGIAAVSLTARGLLGEPFVLEGPILNLAHARHAPLGDAYHPGLHHLADLSARWSLHPAVARLAPAMWLWAEAGLVVLAARATSGRVAAALAATWLAVEVPRRPGLLDLGAWHLLGAVLAGTTLWLATRRPGARGDTWDALGLSALLVGTSWAGLPAVAALVAVLATDALSRRGPVLPALAAAAVGIAGVVALVGTLPARLSWHAPTPWPDAPLAGLTALLPWHAWVLAPAVLLAVRRTVRQPDLGWVRFVLGTLTVSFALAAAGVWLGPEESPRAAAAAQPLLLVWLGWGVGRTVVRLPGRTAVAVVGLVAALSATPADRAPETVQPPQEAVLRTLAAEIAADPVPITTDMGHLVPLLTYPLAVQGQGSLRPLVGPWHRTALGRRIAHTPCDACLADAACRERAGQGWVILDLRPGHSAIACADALTAGCDVRYDGRARTDAVVARCGPP